MIRDEAKLVRVGTRGSALAMRQAELIVGLLRKRHPEVPFQIVKVQTRGDTNQDRPITALGDKAVFIRTIEDALLAGRVDLAVHSLKDVPADVETPGLKLAAFSAREDARDVVISPLGGLSELPAGAVVGTGSLRRRIQLLSSRPDLEVAGIRGNVDTRLRKLDAGQYDALVLAAAGLRRLGLEARITQYLSVDECVPDAGQGIVVVQARDGDVAADIASTIDDAGSRTVAIAERAVVRALGAGCHSPVGAFAEIRNDRIRVVGMAAIEGSSRLFHDEETGPAAEAADVGTTLGLRLLASIY